MKNLIIVGASRSGKSTVAKKIAENFNMSYIPFDAIVSTIENLYPDTGIKHLDDNSVMSVKVSKLLEEFISHLEYEDINYVIDLYQIYPRDLHRVVDEEKQTVVYFGYPHLKPEEKLAFVKTYAREKDWTRNTPDKDMLEILKLFINENRIMYRECLDVGYRFFDTGVDFSITLESAIQYISKEINSV